MVAALGSAVRSAAAAAGAAIALLLAIALLADVPQLASWLPTRLADGVAIPFHHPPARDVWRRVVVAVATSCALVAAALARVGHRRP